MIPRRKKKESDYFPRFERAYVQSPVTRTARRRRQISVDNPTKFLVLRAEKEREHEEDLQEEKEIAEALPRRLQVIQELQTRDGFWHMSTRLVNALGGTIPDAPKGCSDWEWATALVITRLRQYPHYFPKLQEAHDGGMEWVPRKSVLRQAREALPPADTPLHFSEELVRRGEWKRSMMNIMDTQGYAPFVATGADPDDDFVDEDGAGDGDGDGGEAGVGQEGTTLGATATTATTNSGTSISVDFVDTAGCESTAGGTLDSSAMVTAERGSTGARADSGTNARSFRASLPRIPRSSQKVIEQARTEYDALRRQAKRHGVDVNEALTLYWTTHSKKLASKAKTVHIPQRLVQEAEERRQLQLSMRLQQDTARNRARSRAEARLTAIQGEQVPEWDDSPVHRPPRSPSREPVPSARQTMGPSSPIATDRARSPGGFSASPGTPTGFGGLGGTGAVQRSASAHQLGAHHNSGPNSSLGSSGSPRQRLQFVDHSSAVSLPSSPSPGEGMAATQSPSVHSPCRQARRGRGQRRKAGRRRKRRTVGSPEQPQQQDVRSGNRELMIAEMVVLECLHEYDEVLKRVYECAGKSANDYREAPLYIQRQHKVSELSTMLGDGMAPQAGYLDWRVNGTPSLRKATLALADALARWKDVRKRLVRPDPNKVLKDSELGKEERPVFVWGGVPVTHRVAASLNNLRSFPELEDWYGDDFPFEWNPLMLPTPLHHRPPTPPVAKQKALIDGQEMTVVNKEVQKVRDDLLAEHERMHQWWKSCPSWWPRPPETAEALERVRRAEKLMIEELGDLLPRETRPTETTERGESPNEAAEEG